MKNKNSKFIEIVKPLEKFFFCLFFEIPFFVLKVVLSVYFVNYLSRLKIFNKGINYVEHTLIVFFLFIFSWFILNFFFKFICWIVKRKISKNKNLKTILSSKLMKAFLFVISSVPMTIFFFSLLLKEISLKGINYEKKFLESFFLLFKK